MTWASKRQFFFLAVILAFFLVFGFLIIFSYLNDPPTCSDGKQNGTETGIDCGGSCQRVCLFEADKISILWSRAFRVLPGRYNAIAYLENKNENNAVEKVSYRFRFADSNNIYIGKRDGETFIPPARKFAIFEPAVELGNSVPVYTTFEFTTEPDWVKVSPNKVRELQVSISDIRLVDEATNPKLFATVRNRSLFQIPKLSIVAILYDSLGNAVSTSNTTIEALLRETSVPVSFTWPEAFDRSVVVKELIPMYNIFSVELK
jgi:hypothetical protein